MKTVKKLIGLVIIIAISLSCIACDMQAKTYEPSKLDYFTFAEVEGGYSVSAKNKADLPSTLAIPEEYEGKAVVEIASGAFTGANVTKLIIPKTILKIGERAFANSTLSEIYFFTGVQEIGTGAFYGCASLKKLNLPTSVITIGDSAFNSCISITNLKLPDKLEVIGSASFANCLSLESVYIPRRVNSIGENAFLNCSEKIEFEISAGNEHYKLDENGRPTQR